MSIKKHIPNTITSMNLLCGVLGVIASSYGRPDTAFLLMLAAAGFDFCDGLSARLLGAYSDTGKELDSLSDVVSFGVLPSILLRNTMLSLGCSGIWTWIPLVLVVFSALRLAKFNVDPRQHESFIGLATPPSAMICGSLCSFIYSSTDSAVAVFCAHCWVLPALALALSALLVCEIPMFAMKFGKGTSKAEAAIVRKRVIFLAAAAAGLILVVALGMNWTLSVVIAFAVYILINLF